MAFESSVRLLGMDTKRIHAEFFERTLPKSAWTHEAHLAVCWRSLALDAPHVALDKLRAAIRAYNEVTGVPNTAKSGYHETLTRYYVEAVAELASESFEAVVADASTDRSAPLKYWSRDRLFSPAARRGWMTPDLCPLPWAEG